MSPVSNAPTERKPHAIPHVLDRADARDLKAISRLLDRHGACALMRLFAQHVVASDAPEALRVAAHNVVHYTGWLQRVLGYDDRASALIIDAPADSGREAA
jgi:hypothetical protein